MTFSSLIHPHPLALDLGTAWTRAVSATGRRYCARSERRGERAVQGGAVIDGAPTAEILYEAFETLRSRFTRALPVAACVSSCASEAEQERYTHTLHRHGASAVTLVPTPIAAALGTGLDPSSHYSQMIVDIGDGFTEYAVIRRGRVETSRLLDFGCGNLRDVFFEKPHADAYDLMQWWSRSLPSVEERDEALAAQDEPFSLLSETLLDFFRDLPDRMACEVIENGVLLVGGGALLRGVRGRLSARTGFLIRVPANPLTATIDGAAQVLPYLQN